MAGSVIQILDKARRDPVMVQLAREAACIVADWLDCERLPSMRSGSDTGSRMLLRVALGMTAQEAASAEYAYRWHLPLNQWVSHSEARSKSKPVTGAWPVPHCIGL